MRRIFVKLTCLAMILLSFSTNDLLAPSGALAQEEPSDDRAIEIAWSPDGTLLAVGYLYGRLEIWDVATNTLLSSLTGHPKTIGALAWSPQGDQLVSGSHDYTARVWDVSTGDSRLLAQTTSSIWAVGWSPDGASIIVLSSESQPNFTVFDAATRQLIYEAQMPSPTYISWSPDGAYIGISYIDLTVAIRDSRSFEHIKYIGTDPQDYGAGALGWQIVTFAWSPDGQYVVSGSLLNFVDLWDVQTGENIFSEFGNDDLGEEIAPRIILAVWFNQDGTTYSSLSGNGTLRTWSVLSGELLDETSVSDTLVSTATVSPDGKTLAFATWDEIIHFYPLDGDLQ